MQFIVFLLSWFCMVCTIHFNNKSLIWCKEVNNKVTYNVLPLNFHSQSIMSYMLPQHMFRYGCILSVLTSKSPKQRINVRRCRFIFHLNLYQQPSLHPPFPPP